MPAQAGIQKRENIGFALDPRFRGGERKETCGSARLPKRSDIEGALRRLAPRIPPHEFGAIVDHALDSRGLRVATPEAAAWLALVSYVRHTLTEYDGLLEQGYDVESARHFVLAEMDEILKRWGVRRALKDND